MKKLFLKILIIIVFIIVSLIFIEYSRENNTESIVHDNSFELYQSNSLQSSSVENTITNNSVETIINQNNISENKKINSDANKTRKSDTKEKSIEKTKTKSTEESTTTKSISNTTSTAKQDKSSSSSNKTTSKNPTNSSLSNKTTQSNMEEKHKHVFNVNGGWFNTNAEAEAKVDKVFNDWNTKYEKGQITWEELAKKCPMGYEIYRCSCGKYGLNFTY